MKLIKRVNLLDDKKLIMKLNILTIPLLVIFFALFTLLTLDRKLSEEVTIDLMSINGRVNHLSRIDSRDFF